ncbi:MAG: 50S ribosomal protein L25/general stress protein Ctc [Kistimonas sp.]|nr:50S ribosomal protein L25/general stress protein Ctc [Kistimonas sp.]
MSEFALTAVERTEAGTGASRRLRRTDKVPAIVYGGDTAPVQVVLEGKTLRKALNTPSFHNQIINLDVDGSSCRTIIKDIQVHPARGDVMHMDFLRVDATHLVTTTVPLRFHGEDSAPGIKAGGIASHTLQSVEVRCLAQNLPEHLDVDLSQMKMDETIHLSQLQLPTGISLSQLEQGTDHDLPVVSIHAPRGKAESTESED